MYILLVAWGLDVVVEMWEGVKLLWFLHCGEDQQFNSSDFFIQKFSFYEHAAE
jgi:hypothetical protein